MLEYSDMTSISSEKSAPSDQTQENNIEAKTGLLQNITTKQAAFGLLILCGVLYFLWLGKRDLWAPDEPRFALVSKEMMESGDYIVPRRNGKPASYAKPFVGERQTLSWGAADLELGSGRPELGSGRP